MLKLGYTLRSLVDKLKIKALTDNFNAPCLKYILIFEYLQTIILVQHGKK